MHRVRFNKEMAESRDMPDDLHTALDVAYTNSFGFQPEKKNGWIVVCIIDQPRTEDHAMRSAFDPTYCFDPRDNHLPKWMKSLQLGPADLMIINFLGCWFARLHYTKWDLIPELINTILADGLDLTLQTQMKPFWKAGDYFDPAHMEQSYLNYLKSHLVSPRKLLRFQVNAWKWPHLHNWHTPEGKEFARKCQEFMQDDGNPDNWNVFHTHGDVFKKYKVMNHASWWWGPREEEQKEADTLVKPCGCRVVCRSCSVKLKQTADARICVKCRNPIVEVMEI
jgi:hypothetical protein